MVQVIQQPRPYLRKEGDSPAPGLDVKQLVGLSMEEMGVVLAGLTPAERLPIIREVQDIRRATQADLDFEAEVEHIQAKKRARTEAERRDRVTREAYLSSDEGLAEAAARFRAAAPDIDDLEEPEELIEGFLYMDTLVRTFGAPKTLKSFVTLDMAACVSLGMAWHGRRTRQAKTLYIVAEGARGFVKRRDAWNEFHQTEMKAEFYPRPVQIGDDDEMHDLVAYCRVHQFEYIVFDTQARCTVGVEENDNTEMGVVVHALGVLRAKTGACVHMVHHAVGSDPTKARGATAWDGAVDSEFYTKRDRKAGTVELVSKFQKDVEEADTIEFTPLKAGRSLVLDMTGGGESGSAGTGEVAPALVSDPNMFYLQALSEFGPQDVTISDMAEKLKGHRSRSAIKTAYGALLTGGAVVPSGSRTGVRITQGGLVALDIWRRKNPPEEGVIPGVT